MVPKGHVKTNWPGSVLRISRPEKPWANGIGRHNLGIWNHLLTKMRTDTGVCYQLDCSACGSRLASQVCAGAFSKRYRGTLAQWGGG